MNKQRPCSYMHGCTHERCLSPTSLHMLCPAAPCLQLTHDAVGSLSNAVQLLVLLHRVQHGQALLVVLLLLLRYR